MLYLRTSYNKWNLMENEKQELSANSSNGTPETVNEEVETLANENVASSNEADGIKNEDMECSDKICRKKKLLVASLVVSNVVLLIAVIVLFVLHFSKSGNSEISSSKQSVKVVNSAESQFPVAYIQVDSLLANYIFAKQANESLLRKSETSRSQLQRKMQEWQKEAADFQQKAQTNAFLSRERAESEQNNLLKNRQDLQLLDQRLTKELLQEQEKLNEQLKDTINTFLKEYNKDHNYKIILANTVNDNILYSEEECDITKDVVDKLNARYKSNK